VTETLSTRRAALAAAAGIAALAVAALLLASLYGRGVAQEAKPLVGGSSGTSPGTCDDSLVIQPPFDAAYRCFSLGSVPGLPPNYGGLVFLNGDPNTLLIAGNANTESGALYRIGLVRDGTGHITGFSGEVARFADAAYNDGGIVYGPDSILFLARWPVNAIGQTLPGSAITDKIVDLTPFEVCPAVSALNFVPPGFPGAGQLKLVTWGGGCWYTANITSDGNRTYDVTGVVSEVTITGGPEGFIYVPPGSPSFTAFDSMLVAEYSAGNIASYGLDANGDPEPETRATFISGLSGAEGAAIDPLTGDFLFSTFGGGNQVVAIRGFAAPPTPTSTQTVAEQTPTPTQTPTSTTVPPTVTQTATPRPPTATRTPTPTLAATHTGTPRPPTRTPTLPPPTRTPTPRPPTDTPRPPTAIPTSTLPPTATQLPTSTPPPAPAEATATQQALDQIAGAIATAEALSAEATATAAAVGATATAEVGTATAVSMNATATSDARTATARAPRPTPTPESDVLGVATPGSGNGGGGSSGGRVPSFGVKAGQPETTAAVLSLDQISKNPRVVGTNLLLAIILLVVLLVSSTVFNETVTEHRVELQGYALRFMSPFTGIGDRFNNVRPSALTSSSWVSGLLGPILLLGATAAVYSLNEPHLGFDGKTALLFSSLLISIAVITYVVEGGEALVTNRRFGVDAGIRLVPIAIAIAAGFVLLSRLVSFDAPVMYGFIASATALGVVGLERKDAATAVVVPAIALLAVSIGAWLLLEPLRDATSGDDAWWAHVPGEAAAAIFVGGVEGLLFVLLPVRFTDGEKVFRWYRWLWFPLFLTPLFFFCWVILNPQAKEFDALLEGRVVFIASLVAIYAAVSGLCWAYFSFRRTRSIRL
jgi:hypothetical protein